MGVGLHFLLGRGARPRLLRLCVLLFGSTMVCALIYRWVGVHVDANGVLRETFPAIPLGYLFATGCLMSATAWVVLSLAALWQRR
jgi:hypothetical protein